ncbi:MAG: hypothetical protein AB1733_04825 [Thermodesulfobacteriota bacterium]
MGAVCIIWSGFIEQQWVVRGFLQQWLLASELIEQRLCLALGEQLLQRLCRLRGVLCSCEQQLQWICI